MMANHTYIEKTVFTNPHTKSKSYGYRMFDDFASMYNDSMDRKTFVTASSLDIARYAYRNGNAISSDMFEDAANQGKPIYVNDLPFFTKDWKGDPDE
jgi:hypothetical protein